MVGDAIHSFELSILQQAIAKLAVCSKMEHTVICNVQIGFLIVKGYCDTNGR
jgi:hypothetical protein